LTIYAFSFPDESAPCGCNYCLILLCSGSCTVFSTPDLRYFHKMSGKPTSQVAVVDGDSIGRIVKLAISVGGIYTCYLAYGIFQEELYTVQPDGTKFSATAFVLLVQCLANGLIALIGDFLDLFVFKSKATENGSFRWLHVLPTYAVLSTSVVYVLAMYTSNEALGFVSYPTQALVKSCKMIPVMLGSIIISGTSYKLLKYVCVLLMTVGITMFQFGSKAKKGHDSAESDSEWIGMVLLTASLILDGITGPLQQRLKTLKLTNFEQILVNNTWASLLMLFIAVGLGQLDSSVSEAPSSMLHVVTLAYAYIVAAIIPQQSSEIDWRVGTFRPYVCIRPNFYFLDDTHVRCAYLVHGDNNAQIFHYSDVSVLLRTCSNIAAMAGCWSCRRRHGIGSDCVQRRQSKTQGKSAPPRPSFRLADGVAFQTRLLI
jgi:hypothetical protein